MAVACGGMMAQPSAVQVTEGSLWMKTGGMMPLGVSPGGRYIVGACTSWAGFIYDTETGAIVTTDDIEASVPDDLGANEFYAVSDDGVAYGWDGNGGVAMGIDGSYEVFQPLADYEYVAPMACSADGSVVAGYVNPSFTLNEPCYWENGEIHILPYSTSEEAGFKINGGCQARWISADGSVIMGQLMTRSQRAPMVYWIRQDDGSYSYVPAFKAFYEDDRDVSGNLKEYYSSLLPKLFMPACLSPDGKTAALYVIMVEEKNGQNVLTPEQLAIYDLEKNDFKTVIPYNPANLLYSRDNFYIQGISSQGILVGFSGAPAGDSTPILLFPEDYDKAVTFTEAFPGVELLEEYSDFEEDWGGLYLATAMSADCSTIVGYIEYSVEVNNFPYDFGMAAYYVRTDYVDSGVDAIDAVAPEGTPAFYDLQGRRVASPDRGLYIKVADGKAEKVVK